MDEDEYDDELPPISVNCSSKEESVFSMPSAEVLASQRAREEECERELREMREQHEQQQAQLAAVASAAPIVPSRSNSSSSEGESVLASAVESVITGGDADRLIYIIDNFQLSRSVLVINTQCLPPLKSLRVNSSPVLNVQRPTSAELLAAVLAQLPVGARTFCQDYAEALHRASERDIQTLTDDLVTGIGSWLCGFDMETAKLESSGDSPADSPAAGAPSDDEVLGIGAWLCVSVLCRAPSAPRARCRRALHALLAAANNEQVSSLSVVLVRAVPCPRVRLELSAAAAAAGREPRALRLAAALSRAALADLLADNADTDAGTGPLSLQEVCELCRRGWRGVSAARRDVALQLLGRALAAAKLAPAERAEHAERRAALAGALSALAQPLHAAPQDRHQPDHLKIAVAASKLQILLSDRN